MIEDNWKPTQDDIDWTKEHYTRMQVGDTWGVADAVLRKDEDNTLTILQASPASLLPLERIKKVCEEIDVELISDGAEMIHDAQAAAQQAAQEWTCPKSGVPIVNFDLDNAEWVSIGIMAPCDVKAIEALQSITEKYPLINFENLDSLHADGSVFLKGNQKTGNVFIRSENGLGEGILITCQSDEDAKVSDTYGPFPLDFFT